MTQNGIIGFIKDFEAKLTYNHSESQPSGLGEKVLQYICSTPDEQMENDFKNIQLISPDKQPTKKDIFNYTAITHSKIQSNPDWYDVLLPHQGYLAELSKIGVMIDNEEFLQDSLFCEYGYVINLTTKSLEFYSTEQEKPRSNNSDRKPTFIITLNSIRAANGIIDWGIESLDKAVA